MAESSGSGISVALFSLVAGGLLLGGWYLLRHHDRVVKGYVAGSVCDRLYDRTHAASLAWVQTQASPTETNGVYDANATNRAMLDRNVEAEAGRRDEFAAILAGLRAADDAVRQRGQPPLFCLPTSPDQDGSALYVSYWNATESRAKDAAVCRRDFAADILVFATETYRCAQLPSK